MHYLPFNEHIGFCNATMRPLVLYGGEFWSMTSKAKLDEFFDYKRAAKTTLDVNTKEERTVSLL